MLLKHYSFPIKMKTIWLFQLLLCVATQQARGTALNLTSLEKKILDGVSWNIKLLLLKEGPGSTERHRRVGVQAYILPGPIRRQDTEHPEAEAAPMNDDLDMKMKLFRLMYETVRDSDLKVKRAELINSYYTNSSSFEIGYLMGDVTEKFSAMSDISSTLKRLYDTWKPIEHINAYEQIANQAIEISHLIELVRTVNKKGHSEVFDTTR